MFELPVRIVKFWYPSSFFTFMMIWSNTIALLEEDLAVFLMARLLFVPLFHDSSIVGRVLSVIFRLFRILIGLIAFVFATLAILTIALIWFALPILIFIPNPIFLSLMLKVIFILGLGLFALRVMILPRKSLAEIKKPDEILDATKLEKIDLTWKKILESKAVQEILNNLEIDKTNFENFNIPITDAIYKEVLSLAKKNNAKSLDQGYFFLAMLKSIPLIDKELLKLNLNLADFENTISYLQLKKNTWQAVYIWDNKFSVKHLKGVNRGWLGVPTPSLDSASEDLTKMAATKGFPDFIGREEVLSEVVNILSQEKDKNVILVGPPGAGKTTLVNYLAKKIVTGDAPPSLATKRLVRLDLGKLMSGVSTQGSLAEKIKNIFEEVRFADDIIIYVDEISNLGIGEVGVEFNLFSLMLPHLESSEFQFIGSTQSESYSKILEKNSALVRLFTRVEVPPASKDDTIKVLQTYAINLEKDKKIKVNYLAIKEMVELSFKLIHDRVLPDSALAILNEAEALEKDGKITTYEVKKVLSERINVPLEAVGSTQRDRLLNLENLIHEKLIDQEEAVKAVADTLRRAAAALREENRPIGSFLFVGPTGVGKTELAKTLAEIYFKDRGAYLRFDMSEYQNEDSLNRLIGTQENPGVLTDQIRNKPYVLLLLDEFEKANKNILNLFLQVLDDGHLTDGSGREIDFTNSIIIATSNAASLTIANGLAKGASLADLEEGVKEELLNIFKPELVNRFDSVVIFKPLSAEDLTKIVDLKLKSLASLMKDQGYLISFEEGLVKQLAIKGFDPVLGARPLRRLIQDTLEARLAMMILNNQIAKGENIEVGVDMLS
ncbi:AAA family ATPase [Candidatus Daviesbacteria bacterium]|nr:AAA family ATPase [Candidatus Daviesbacteria bacterium]